MADTEEKIAREFAIKYGYLPGQAKQLASFVKTVHHFAQYLGSNKYFSNELNKRIAVLTLDTDILALRVEKVRLTAENFYAQAEMAVLKKTKLELDKAKVEEFKKEVAALNSEALETYQRALTLMKDIRTEYADRGNQ